MYSLCVYAYELAWGHVYVHVVSGVMDMNAMMSYGLCMLQLCCNNPWLVLCLTVSKPIKQIPTSTVTNKSALRLQTKISSYMHIFFANVGGV